MRSASDLSGRVAVVTGGSRNIGAAIAERLAAAGAAVAVNDLARDAAEAVANRVVTAGGTAAAFVADVSSDAQVQLMMSAISESLGPPQILVNNAAISVMNRTTWHELDPGDWDRVLRVNLIGAFICSRAIRPYMITQGSGSIVSLASVTALLGLTNNLHYVASKAGLVGFTRALAREAGSEGIRVNAVVAGAIETPEEAIHGSREDRESILFGVQSLGRRGQPGDVAEAVAFLVSDQAAFITGQCLTVDGGWVMS